MADYTDIVSNTNIASYATTIPPLMAWSGVFVRIMIQKEMKQFCKLIQISILMIVS
jgi:hypothetical protein